MSGTLHGKRTRLFAYYEKGVVTMSAVLVEFVNLLVTAHDDDSAIQLCAGLPSWFASRLADWISEMAPGNYYVKTFSIGDSRNNEEIHQDALRRQQTLLRLAPQILQAVKSQLPPTM